MPIFLPYILIIVVAFVASFSSLSRGSFFNEIAKFIILAIALIVLITFCIVITILYSWVHIPGLLGTFVISAWISAAVFK